MSECSLRHALGAYVIGGLEPEEHGLVADHLRVCATCRAEHAAIATTPDLLALAAHAPPEVPSRVRDRLVARAARGRGRRRWALATAAALLGVAVVGAAVGHQLSPEPPPTIAVPLEQSEPFEASGWAWLTPQEDSLTLRLDIRGLVPLEHPEVYEAWLSTVDGRVVSVGQIPEVEDEVRFEVTTTGSLADYAGLWVTAEPDGRDPAHEGPTVVSASIPDGDAPPDDPGGEPGDVPGGEPSGGSREQPWD